jgi:hypothetical protein
LFLSAQFFLPFAGVAADAEVKLICRVARGRNELAVYAIRAVNLAGFEFAVLGDIFPLVDFRFQSFKAFE